VATIPPYDREEVARIGDETYERNVLPNLGPEDEGKFALIDVQTGDYEVDRDEIAASDRLLARHPDAQVWTRQVGSRYARRFGPRLKNTAA
jgi:ABC-type branched-subunit amino acid transport system ATPase component